MYLRAGTSCRQRSFPFHAEDRGMIYAAQTHCCQHYQPAHQAEQNKICLRLLPALSWLSVYARASSCGNLLSSMFLNSSCSTRLLCICGSRLLLLSRAKDRTSSLKSKASIFRTAWWTVITIRSNQLYAPISLKSLCRINLLHFHLHNPHQKCGIFDKIFIRNFSAFSSLDHGRHSRRLNGNFFRSQNLIRNNSFRCFFRN